MHPSLSVAPESTDVAILWKLPEHITCGAGFHYYLKTPGHRHTEMNSSLSLHVYNIDNPS